MPGLIRGVARTAVIAGTATAVSNRVSRRQSNRWSQQEQQQYEQQQYEQQQAQAAYAQQQAAAAPAPAAAGGDDMVAKLTELKGLLDQGILTQEEFDAQKAKILNAQ
jgi:transcription initiation factor TFIID subunit TAF12